MKLLYKTHPDLREIKEVDINKFANFLLTEYVKK